jgi:tetratricopeptide (TPR) repeat protein
MVRSLHDRRAALPACAAAALLLIAAACRPSVTDSASPREAALQALRRGALDEALSHVARGIDDTRPDGDSPAVRQLRLLEAEILLAKPDVEKAAPLVAQPIPDSPEFAPLRTRHQYVRARLEVAQGQLKQALATLDALSGIEPEQPETRLDAGVLAGQVLIRLGRWNDAETRLKAVVDEAQARGDRYRLALAFNNLGMRQLFQRRCDEALAWFTRVLSMSDLEQASVYALSLNNAGACYARLGQFDLALGLQQRAVEESRGRLRPRRKLGRGGALQRASPAPAGNERWQDAVHDAARGGHRHGPPERHSGH